jgi:ABC-2 type transport system ATP-binding protein
MTSVGAESASADPVVEVVDLRMRYGDKDVLRGVDLTIRRGEVLALLGPNGAGKTTMIEILEGFRQRSAGQVRVLGVDPAVGGEAWRARVGIVLQSWRDHGKWRVRQFLTNQGSLYVPFGTDRVPRPWDVDDLLASVGLADQADQQVRRLSGGQRRRLDVAVGLIGRPDVLFLDEPTAGLDPQARRDFHDLMRHVSDELDVTVLLTTHDLAEAEKLADRIAILVAGGVIAEGTSEQLSRRVASRDRVRWVQDGRRFEEAPAESTAFVRALLCDDRAASVSELEVHRASLEDAYLGLVRAAEHPAAEADDAA